MCTTRWSVLVSFTVLVLLQYFAVSSVPAYEYKYVGSTKNSSFIDCRKQYYDRVLYTGPIQKPYKFLQVVTKNVKISTGNAYIHCIEAIDVKADGNGAEVSTLTGGIQHNYVTLHFESQRNHGIHFNLTIYGS